MTQEKVSPLRERMMEDMRIRGMGDKSQKAHIRALKDFSAFLGRSPDTAEPDDLRAYQLHMADTGVTPSTFNARIVALRFFFSMTCDRDGMKKYMQFRTEPRKLPIVLSVEEVCPAGSGTRTWSQIPRSPEHWLWRRFTRIRSHPPEGPRHRQRPHADPCRTGQGRQGPRCDAVTIFACFTAGLLARGPSTRLVVSRSEPCRSNIASSVEPGVYISQTYGRDQKARNASHPAAQFCDTSVGGKHGCASNPGSARAFQAEYDGAIHPRRNKDVGRYHQPV